MTETTATARLEFTVSAGHDEYPIPEVFAPGELTCIWANDYEDEDEFGADWEAGLAARYRDENDAEPGDWDLGWERIYRIDAPADTVAEALVILLQDLDTIQGADDDTFDYWPSGMRLALDIAARLGGDWPAQAEAQARRVIFSDREEFAEELLDKVGLEPPETLGVPYGEAGVSDDGHATVTCPECAQVFTEGGDEDTATKGAALAYSWHWERAHSDYVTRVRAALFGPDAALEAIAPWLTRTCTECGMVPAEGDTEHVVINGAVVFGCEGYALVRPAAVGLPDQKWDDWTAYYHGTGADRRRYSWKRPATPRFDDLVEFWDSGAAEGLIGPVPRDRWYRSTVTVASDLPGASPVGTPVLVPARGGACFTGPQMADPARREAIKRTAAMRRSLGV